MSNKILETGHRAFEAFKHSVETGDAQQLLALLTDDFTFTSPIPVGEFQGKQVGKKRVAALTHWRWNDLQMRASMTLLTVTSSEKTVGFEWLHEGTNRGQLYTNRLAIFFDVRGDKISAWREYVNEVDPEAVANAAVAPT